MLGGLSFPFYQKFEARETGALGDDAFPDVFLFGVGRGWRSDLVSYCIRGLRCGVSVRLVINGSDTELLVDYIRPGCFFEVFRGCNVLLSREEAILITTIAGYIKPLVDLLRYEKVLFTAPRRLLFIVHFLG